MLAISLDGFCPFSKDRNLSILWPCFVKLLNLPPWLRHKAQFMFITFMTEGPQAPKTLAAYIDIVVDELIDM